MSSPFRASDQARSTPRSSPSRQDRAGVRSSPRLNGLHGSETQHSQQFDSPSRQLWEEFGRIVLDEDRNFKRSLDEQTHEQEKRHRQALDESLARHEAVRQSAERARERVELEILRARKHREENERQAAEELRRKLDEEEAERERKRVAAAKQQEGDRKERERLLRQQEELERRNEAQKQRQRQERDEDARRAAQDKIEEDRKSKEKAEARQGQQQAQSQRTTSFSQQPSQATPQTNGEGTQIPAREGTKTTQPPPNAAATASPGLVSTTEQRQAQHQKYIDLWKRLKEFRKTTEEQCDKAGFRIAGEKLGDLKRTMKLQVSLVNKFEKAANKQYLIKSEAILQQAMSVPGPTVDIRKYLPSLPPADLASTIDPQYPSLVLYLLSHFAKNVIRQLITESGNDLEHADPLGIMLIQVFSNPKWQWNGHSLIDVLWAKYHVVLPQIFGIPGPEVENDEDARRIIGLAAGFSAFTLRDFSKSRNRNPAPNAMWWQSVARIVNLPAGQTQRMHYVMLKAMIEEYAPRILTLFGGAGKALLRTMVKKFPEKGPRTKQGPCPEVLALEGMGMIFQTKYLVTL
ncbi:hypothetical protein LTR62_006054 [Meristemomyces frigidus]|uniref:mRNA export factor GLE1 n=1 Tax=Meristemomyces frigidus TaxID=1508187 RepID=A0AAN7TCW8_9PEZI|nr:hypothetical protein LTR62_006054 [Meristemomyces frigidus]